MKRLCDTISIVAAREVNSSNYEVCATELADFDEEASKVMVHLDSFVRLVNPRGPDVLTHPGWLPSAENFEHCVSQDEARAEARQAFAGWKNKVRRSIPPAPFAASSSEPPHGSTAVS